MNNTQVKDEVNLPEFIEEEQESKFIEEENKKLDRQINNFKRKLNKLFFSFAKLVVVFISAWQLFELLRGI